MEQQGLLDAEELEGRANAGEIDTVLCMFTDLQGRFMGKRVLPDFFLHEILGEEGLHACLYLLAIDMEMEPLPGYEYASWETGLRRLPHGARHVDPAVVPVAREDRDGDLRHRRRGDRASRSRWRPAQILKRQIARAAKAGYTIKTGSELEFYLFKDGYDELAERGYRDPSPSSSYIMDYHMLQTTKDEWIIRQIRNGMRGAGIPVEFSKGEFGKGQHEINITYADALTTADYHVLYKHGVKEICARQRRRRHVHGQVDDGGGRLVVPHAFQRLEREGHEDR